MSFVENVELLLAQAWPEGIYYLGRSRAWVTVATYRASTGPGTFVATDGDDVAMMSEPAALLEKLYATADPNERRVLPETMLRLLNVKNARVVARTLAVTGNIGVLGIANLTDPTVELWRGVIHSMRFEPGLFDEADLLAVKRSIHVYGSAVAQAAVDEAKRGGTGLSRSMFKQTPSGEQHFVGPAHELVEEVESVVARVRYLRLAATIRANQNPAIDADRQVLLSRLQSMGFSDGLSGASNRIEQKAVTAASSADVKAVIDLLRTFYEEFIEEACGKVADKGGKPVPSGTRVSHFASFKDYLATSGFVGPEETELLQKLYNFLSNQGTHKLGTAPEQLRVAHATVIEWCMLIAGRVQQFLN